MNEDGSRGVVFYINAAGTKGWMCAMTDLNVDGNSTFIWRQQGCGERDDSIQVIAPNYNGEWADDIALLNDVDGWRNMDKLLSSQFSQCYIIAQLVNDND